MPLPDVFVHAARLPGQALLRSTWAVDLVLGTLPRDCSIVLAFHRVGEDIPSWHEGSTPASLEWVLATFARVATPVEVGGLDVAGRGRRLAITFDDGFADNAAVAAPLLARLGLPAAFFVPTACIETGTAPWPERAYAGLLQLGPARILRLAARLAPERSCATALDAAHAVVHGLKLLEPSRRQRLLAALPEGGSAGRPMSWEQVRGLRAAGFAVGSHGHTHSVLTTLGDAELAFELAESRRLIELRLGSGCDLLAYPDNRSDQRVREAAAAAGYRLAFEGGDRLNAATVDRLGIQRIAGDCRPLAAALRLRRRDVGEPDGGDLVARRLREYGFLTQALRVRETLARARPARVLDAGCGPGALTQFLREAGVSEIVRVDVAPGRVDTARLRWPEERWLQADIRALPFSGGRFDAAVCLGVLEFVADAEGALRELARVTRPGGRVIVSVQQRNAPNDLGFRLAAVFGRARHDPWRAMSERELVRAARLAGLGGIEVRAANFFAFPLDILFRRTSRRVAERLEGAGGLGGVRRLGAQLVLEATVERAQAVVWLTPSLSAPATFFERELEGLRRLGVTVAAAEPRLGLGALATAARHPLASLLLVVQLQALKASKDRERGRAGYLVLALRGMTLAATLERSRARVHATFADGVGTVAYCAARLAGVPFTFSAHSPYSLWQGSRLLRRQAEAAERVFCVSEDMERRIGALAPRSRRTVVRCLGPEATPATLPLAEPPLVLGVGSFVPHKGFQTALDAVAFARHRGADVTLELIGDGGGRDALQAHAARLGIGSHVRFPGRLANGRVLERLAAALALLAPSEVQADGDRDGLPVSILDAAACGVPAIATAVSGIPEFVVDEVTGLIVPERDPEALGCAIVRLVEDRELARRLGQAAKERLADRHSADRELQKLADAWFPRAG